MIKTCILYLSLSGFKITTRSNAQLITFVFTKCFMARDEMDPRHILERLRLRQEHIPDWTLVYHRVKSIIHTACIIYPAIEMTYHDLSSP